MTQLSYNYFHRGLNGLAILLCALQSIILAAHCSGGDTVLFFVLFFLAAGAMVFIFRIVRISVQRAFAYYGQLVVETNKEHELQSPAIVEEPYVPVVDAYVKDILLKYGFSETDIQLIHHYMYMLRHHVISQASLHTPITHLDSVSQNDLKRLAWNIGKVYGVSGYDCALFVKIAFSNWFKGTTVETIKSSLRDSRGEKRIPLFTPEDIAAIRGV